MANSVQLDFQGPDWPLGFVAVATPGTPISFMFNVDPANTNSPNSPTSATSQEYTVRAEEILVQAIRPGASHGMQLNIGNVYILRAPTAGASGNRDDPGSLVAMLLPGQTLFLTAAALNRNVWSPYRYYVDADNAGDGVIVTLIIQ